MMMAEELNTRTVEFNAYHGHLSVLTTGEVLDTNYDLEGTVHLVRTLTRRGLKFYLVHEKDDELVGTPTDINSWFH